jgi:hypothetical protein
VKIGFWRVLVKLLRFRGVRVPADVILFGDKLRMKMCEKIGVKRQEILGSFELGKVGSWCLEIIG